MIKNANVRDGEEGHIDTKTLPMEYRLRSILFNLDLKVKKLGGSTTNDGKEFQQSINLLRISKYMHKSIFIRLSSSELIFSFSLLYG